MTEKRFFYTFKYPSGTIVKSGGNDGMCIYDRVDHTQTKIGDLVNVVQFNISGSFPTEAVIIGKLSFDWDMSNPIGSRKSNETISGVGY